MAWGWTWRIALMLVLGWILPDRIPLFLVGIVLVPFNLARLGDVTVRRPAAATLVAFVADASGVSSGAQ